MSNTVQRVIQNQHKIIYVENQGIEPYSKIVYTEKSEVVCGNVGKFEKELNPEQFLRVNRKTLVNLKRSKIENGKAITSYGDIYFSRRKWKEYKKNRLLFLGSLLLMFFTFFSSNSQEIIAPKYSPDGRINSLKSKGDTLIVAGDFNHVGIYTGGGAGFGSSTDDPLLNFPKFNGHVVHSSSDDLGGLYVYGDFYFENESPASKGWRIEYIRNDFSVDTLFSLVVKNNSINQIKYFDNSLYIASTQKSIIGNDTVSALGVYDLNTKEFLNWAPILSDAIGTVSVSRMAITNNTLYFIGSFDLVNGYARQDAAAIDIGNGLTKSWNPAGNWNNYLNYFDILAYDDKIILGGSFDDGASPSSRLHGCAMVDGQSGQTFEYLFSSGGLFGRGAKYLYWGATVRRLAVKNNILYTYSLGTFDTRVTAIDLLNVNLQNNSQAFADGIIWTKYFNTIANASELILKGNSVYVFGNYFENVFYTDSTNNDLANIESSIYGGVRLEADSGKLENWHPNPVHWNENYVETVASIGSGVFLGGRFTHVKGQKRVGVYMIDVSTETILPFEIKFSNDYPSTGINAVELDKNFVYFGGKLSLNSYRDNSILAFDLNTGELVSWFPPEIGEVSSIAVTKSYVFVGGNLTEPSGGRDRYKLFGIDKVNASIIDWGPNPSGGNVNSLGVFNNNLIVGGSFNSISDTTLGTLVSYDLNNLNIVPLNTSFTPYYYASINSILPKNGVLWLGGTLFTINDSTRKNFFGLDAGSSPKVLSNNYSLVGNNVRSISSIGCYYILGGDVKTQNNSTSDGLVFANMDSNITLTDTVFSLNLQGSYKRVNSIASISNEVFFAGDFQKMNDHTRALNIGKIVLPANFFEGCEVNNCGNNLSLGSPNDDLINENTNYKSGESINAAIRVNGSSQVNLESEKSITLLPSNGKSSGFIATPDLNGYIKIEVKSCQ